MRSSISRTSVATSREKYFVLRMPADGVLMKIANVLERLHFKYPLLCF
jgi:hypothetical protein